jgi:hypothetical protein
MDTNAGHGPGAVTHVMGDRSGNQRPEGGREQQAAQPRVLCVVVGEEEERNIQFPVNVLIELLVSQVGLRTRRRTKFTRTSLNS